MDRALNPELLRLALGDSPPQSLPSVEELLELLTQAELALLLQRPEQVNDLLSMGWYLHGIASSKHALGIYGIERQRAAFKVSGHIFDLMAKAPETTQYERLKFVFASQIAYLRSELDPNAMAVYRQEQEAISQIGALNFTDNFGQVSLATGIAFLGFDLNYVFGHSDTVRRQADRLVNEWGVQSMFDTPLGAAYGAIVGTRDLLTFLVYGNETSLQRATDLLRQAVNANASLEDHDSRWVAAHLLNLADGLRSSSLWSALPPDVPPYVRKGFALGAPKVLTLWPPQLELFQSENNPLDPGIRRLFLSTPTGGGKTLLSQLLIVSHLQTQRTPVCYIAPTRSLCREVKRSLAKRLAFIDAEAEVTPEWEDNIITLEGDVPKVEVMTPEQLSYLLRTDSQETLNRFGLFVFDEVHLVGEPKRGWTLEESLTYIHHASRHSHHKIALISAVIGNRNHFIQWMGADDQEPMHTHSDWRGPRRIHAIYTTEPEWDKGIDSETRAKNYAYRTTYPLLGKLDVRISHTGKIHHLSIEEPVGDLVLKFPYRGAVGEKDSKSTAFYKTLVPVIEYLSETGSVMVVESTKQMAYQLASHIANKREEDDEFETDVTPIQYVLDLVEARLTNNHPLYNLLRHGVAYHHGSLPHEIRVAIEEIVAEGHINILVCTTTMTEGVNLPVRSVVIASQGSYGGDGYSEYIIGPKLINAIGRAGRATKETEGIVVLAWSQRLDDSVIERLTPDDLNMQVTSMLASAEALQELALFETGLSELEDAVFQTRYEAVSDFLKFVWFVSAQLEELNQPLDIDHVHSILEHSLGWAQMDENQRSRWSSAANLAVERYRQTEGKSRRRWARSGTSLNSARRLDHMAQEIAESLTVAPVPQTVPEIIDLIFADGRLDAIMQLPEIPNTVVRRRRGGGPADIIDIPLDTMLKEWVSGRSLVELADTYLGDVRDIEFQFLQLGDFINDYFEVSLPWIFSTMISWINETIAETNPLKTLSADIPAYIRWGVDNSVAVELLNRGILSRRLARKIASEWKQEAAASEVYYWIRSMDLAEWHARFDPSTAELRSLLDYARPRRGGPAAELIRQEATQFEVDTDYEEYPATEVIIRPEDDVSMTRLAVFHGEETVGLIRGRDHREMQDILSMGIAIIPTFEANERIGTLTIKTASMEE